MRACLHTRLNRLPVQGSRAVWDRSIIQTASPKKCSYTHNTHAQTHTLTYTHSTRQTQTHTHTLTHTRTHTKAHPQALLCPQSAALPGVLRRRGRSANRPQCESAAGGIGVSGKCASGKWSRLCRGVRAWEGRKGRQGGGADDTGRRRPESPTSAAPPAATGRQHSAARASACSG
jgi:hypothetical protein